MQSPRTGWCSLWKHIGEMVFIFYLVLWVFFHNKNFSVLLKTKWSTCRLVCTAPRQTRTYGNLVKTAVFDFRPWKPCSQKCHVAWGNTLIGRTFLSYLYNSGFTEGVWTCVFLDHYLLYWCSLCNTNGFSCYFTVRCIFLFTSQQHWDLCPHTRKLMLLPSAGQHLSVKRLWMKAQWKGNRLSTPHIL